MNKIRKRLNNSEAQLLNLDLKTINGHGNPKYPITQEQWKIIESTRKKPQQHQNRNQSQSQEEPSLDNTSKTVPNDYTKKKFVLSAWDDKKGEVLCLEDFCNKYNIDFSKVTSSKFLPYHYAHPTYHVVSSEVKKGEDQSIDWEMVRQTLLKEIKSVYTYKPTYHSSNIEGVLKWSDLHFGSYIRNVMHVQDFDKDILLDGLLDSIAVTNNYGFKKVHVHINGDLIESFSGLNHINSWMSMDKDMIGATAIKMCSKMLHTAFQKIDNLGKIKIVAGNHDRLSKDNKEDVKGGAAELICYCLELMGYDVEFHPYVISHFVDGINHINLHGDKGISKKSTEKIILDYGIQGEYNLINEGHLHSLIEKLSIKQRESFEIVKDDSILHRRFYLPSFFPGNYYSATLGYTTNPGYFIIWANKKKRPQFFNGSV
jgi:hypothetical protein